jgi:hypothetical protein
MSVMKSGHIAHVFHNVPHRGTLVFYKGHGGQESHSLLPRQPSGQLELELELVLPQQSEVLQQPATISFSQHPTDKTYQIHKTNWHLTLLTTLSRKTHCQMKKFPDITVDKKCE